MPECVDCTPSRCPNGKCRATNRCIDQFVLPLDEEPRSDGDDGREQRSRDK